MNGLIVLAGNMISVNGLEVPRNCLPASPRLPNLLHSRELVVIDSRVPDIETLRAGVKAEGTAMLLRV